MSADAGSGKSGVAIGAGLVLGAACLWATFGLFTKNLYARGYSPMELASVRAAVGFLGAAAIALVRGPRRLAVPPRALGFFAIYGILGFALFEYIFFAVLDRTTVAVAVALLYTAPAFVLLFSRFVWHEIVAPWKWLSLVLVLVGVVLVTGAADASLEVISAGTLALGLASGAAYAAYTLLSKRATEAFDPLRSLFWSFLFAALAFGVIAPPLPPLLREPDALPTLIALGIVPTLVPYGLYLVGMRYLRASTASMLASVEPMVAALLAAFILHEPLTPLRIGGILLIVLAATIVSVESSGD
jgi:drug/metabolite transporter (DMT)-like permease